MECYNEYLNYCLETVIVYSGAYYKNHMRLINTNKPHTFINNYIKSLKINSSCPYITTIKTIPATISRTI